jgi:hypothetical protein
MKRGQHSEKTLEEFACSFLIVRALWNAAMLQAASPVQAYTYGDQVGGTVSQEYQAQLEDLIRPRLPEGSRVLPTLRAFPRVRLATLALQFSYGTLDVGTYPLLLCGYHVHSERILCWLSWALALLGCVVC